MLKYDFSTLRLARSMRESILQAHQQSEAVSMVRVRVSAVCLARAAPVLCRRSRILVLCPCCEALVLCPWCEYTGRPVLWCEDTGAVSMVRVH